MYILSRLPIEKYVVFSIFVHGIRAKKFPPCHKFSALFLFLLYVEFSKS